MGAAQTRQCPNCRQRIRTHSQHTTRNRDAAAMQQWTESQDRINTWTTVALVSCAGFVLALLLPLLYRVFLYILHGKTAFKPLP